MSDDLADAIALLRRKRAAHIAQVERIDAAVAALLAVIEEPEQRATRTGSGLASKIVATMTDIAQAHTEVQTTRQKIVALAEEADRDWSAGEMIAEYERRGAPFTGSNPDSAVRAAIVTATQKDELYRTSYGRYRSTKFRALHEQGTEAPDAAPNGQAPADMEVQTS